MRLYHFCSKIHLPDIKRQGLTEGRIPLPDWKGDVKGFVKNAQWLTSNPDWSQVWDDQEYSSLPYSRTDFRIELAIPKSERENLYKWLDICQATERLSIATRTLNAYGDPENWFVFMGRIKPGWFRIIKRNPNLKQRTHETRKDRNTRTQV